MLSGVSVEYILNKPLHECAFKYLKLKAEFLPLIHQYVLSCLPPTEQDAICPCLAMSYQLLISNHSKEAPLSGPSNLTEKEVTIIILSPIQHNAPLFSLYP